MDNQDRALTGVVIDPGHGGSDPGAVSGTLKEKDYNLQISKYMYNRFKELGIPTTITRSEDITLSPTERVNAVLSAFGNNPNVIVISNHLNAGGGTGAEVIYALRNNGNLAQIILDELTELGINPRKIYQRRLPSDNSKDYFFIHRNTGITEPVIVEYGFVDDTTSNVNFLKNHYQDLAEAVIKAVFEYKGLKYTAPSVTVTNTYLISKGDTLYSIAQKYNTTVDKLKLLNNLTSNILTVGQVLKIPTSKEITPSTNLYTVKAGDTLYSIAKSFNTSVDEIKSLNNLTSNILTVGSTLEIPTSEYSITTYTVKTGDTLYSISKKYGITVDELKSLNDLTTNTLSLNQVLKVPVINQTTYTVQSGDTLYSIAQIHNTTVDKLKELNNLTSNMLTIGQILILE